MAERTSGDDRGRNRICTFDKPAHEEMHLQGRELLTSIAEKRWQSTDFDRFQNTLLAFTSAVMDYKIYLLNIRSNMDILTGLPGRRVLDESFDRQLLNAEPDKFYLLLLDIDRFKSVNDTLGHLIGDVVLRTLAENLATGCGTMNRSIAMVARSS